MAAGLIFWVQVVARDGNQSKYAPYAELSFSFFHGAHPDQVDTFAEEADARYLQVVRGEHEIGYSRQLTVASPKLVRRRFSKGTLRTVDHDGIETIFLGKASLVWYRSGGKWISASAGD